MANLKDNHAEKDIQNTLRNIFKHRNFKSKTQEEAVRAILKGKQDVFVSMPTGSGKSLCFQLPAVVNDKVTVVFSPLLALMKDQLDYLHNLKIDAKTINSKMTSAERQAVLLDLKSVKPSTRLLYITPEQAQTESFKDIVQKLYKSENLATFVVDEAHCVSQWGHDFRPDYLKLGRLKKLCPKVQWVAVTATASKNVQKDIYDQLKLKSPVASFRVSCFRSNLFYDVVFIDTMDAGDPINDLVEFMQSGTVTNGVEVYGVQYDCGIVYCRTRAQTEDLVAQLQQKRVPAMAYHAGLKDKERFGIQDDWQQEKCKIIVATVSFGMGVDKSNVRFVAHWGLPQSVAGYYQESGRAGRDGNPSRCRIYYSKKEKDAVTFLLNKSLHSAKKESKKQQAKASIASFQCMVKYCEDIKCRHSVFTDYFGDDTPECEDKCDSCVDPKAVQKKIDQFYIMSARTTTSMRTSKFGDDLDLYGGGKAGQQKETEEYGNSGERRNEKTAQQVSNSLIQKQFALRKAPPQISYSSQDSDDGRNSRVKSANITSRKVNGLTVKIRESFLGLIEESLRKNWDVCQYGDDVKTVFTDGELTKCAIEIEYDSFSNNKVASLYKRILMKVVGDLKKNTAICCLDPRLKYWNNGKLNDGVIDFSFSDSPLPSSTAHNKLAQFPVEIKTASQLLAEQNKSSFVSASKLLPKEVQSIPLTQQPKKESIPPRDIKPKVEQKVDKQQMSITSFFSRHSNKEPKTDNIQQKSSFRHCDELNNVVVKKESSTKSRHTSRRGDSKLEGSKSAPSSEIPKPPKSSHKKADMSLLFNSTVTKEEFDEWDRGFVDVTPKVPKSRDPRLGSHSVKVEDVSKKRGEKRKSSSSESGATKKHKETQQEITLKNKSSSKESSSTTGSKSVVVQKLLKILNPHYKTGKIKSREAFKKMAKTISDYLVQRNTTDDEFMQITVLSYLDRKSVFNSESDVDDI